MRRCDRFLTWSLEEHETRPSFAFRQTLFETEFVCRKLLFERLTSGGVVRIDLVGRKNACNGFLHCQHFPFCGTRIVQMELQFCQLERFTTIVSYLDAHRQQAGQLKIRFEEFLALFICEKG